MANRNERSGGAHAAGAHERRTDAKPAEERRGRRESAGGTGDPQRSRPAPTRRGDAQHSHTGRAAEQSLEERRARLAAEQRREAARRAHEPDTRQTRRPPSAHRPRRRRKKTSPLKKALIILLVLALVVLGGLVYLAIHVSESPTNFPNVYLNGIDVGRLTPAQTLEKLNAAGWDTDAAEPMTVTLPLDVRFELDRRSAGVALTAETAAAAAYRYGHSADAYQNLLHFFESLTGKVDVALESPVLDQNYVREETEKAAAMFAARVSGSSEPEVDLENAVIRSVKGAGELSLNTDAVVAGLSAALLDGQRSYSYEQIDGTPTMPDYDRLFTELDVEPRDAYFADDGSFTVIDDVVGCTFDAAAAKEAWQRAGLMETVEIPLTITEPAVTGESLRGLLFRDVLGYQTTTFASSGENRINNIKLAASKLDGLVLMPGETFSYNETIGQRTTEAGFLEAGAYADGEVVQEIGGGICQVSSTLYCATLFANLETVSRTNHYFRVDYLPIGYDATVSWPKPDFKFRNNREFPIRIIAYTTNDTDLTIEIHGTNLDGSYVELTNATYVVNDDTYTNVQIGWGGQVTRHVYDANGNLINTINEPYGIYHKHAEDINWPAEYYAGQTVGGDGSGDAVVIFPGG